MVVGGIIQRTSIFFILLLSSSLFMPTRFAAGAPSPIKTIVVLVMENRSFDHMLGWMKKSIIPSINGVTGRECNPLNPPNQKPTTICYTDDAQYIVADPGHELHQVTEQVFSTGHRPTMSGFVNQAYSVSPNLTRPVMSGFKPESIPVFTTLAKEFAVFDRWFSALPGPTQPNRLFVYSGTSHGAVRHVKRELASGYPQKTIFDSLREEGIDFGNYFQNVPTTLFYRNLRKLKYARKFHHYALSFKKHAKKGILPNLTVIEPRYFDLKRFPANDDHPAHDVANGQRLVKEVYETLRASPQWNQTLFVITYDEHGGFYDHVETPIRDVPSPDGITSPAPHFFKFDRLGVRVPTLMISPWIKKGTVVRRARGPTPSSEYEHSSIPATIKKMFNLRSGFLSHRDAWAGTFEHIVGELTSPRTDCPEKLPEVASMRKSEANEDAHLSEFQRELVELAAVLNGDFSLNTFSEEAGKNMNVKAADEYVKGAVSRFIRASKEASKLGADESSIVNMRASLTTRSPPGN